MDWQKMTIPLGSGQQAEQDPGAGQPTAARVENCVFDKEGVLLPRPSYTRDTLGFQLRGTGAGYSGTTEANTMNVAVNGTVRSLFTTRGRMGEKPGLLRDGHVWIRDTAHWTDHLGMWSTAVTRGPDFSPIPSLSTTSISATAWDLNFGSITQLLDSTGRKVETSIGVNNVSGNVPGMARCGQNTGVFWVEGNNVRYIIRNSGASTLLTGTPATDAQLTATIPQNIWASSSQGAGVFYVVVATNVLGIVRVMRISTAGALLTNVTVNMNYTGDQIKSICCDNDGTTLTIAATYVAATNVRTKVLNATTLADNAIDLALAKTGTGDAEGIVVGVSDKNTAYLAWTTATDHSLFIATRNTTAASGALARTYFGSALAAGTPALTWRTKHQPILWDGRMILGVSAGPDSNEHSWYEIDLRDVNGADLLGPRTTFVSRGPIRASYEPAYPVACLVDSTGWRFGSWEFNSFDVTGGARASDCMITVAPVSPAVVEIAGETVLSGSVPHALTRWANEYGFPFLGAPELAGAVAAGGTMTVGSYTAQATWVYTDPSGVTHRSAPSLPVTLVTTPGNQSLVFKALTLQLTGKTEFPSAVRCELWITAVNPTITALKFLNRTTSNSTSASTVTFVTLNADPLTTTESLYTGAGEILANWPPQGQAGMAVLGRRVWAADQTLVRASKLMADKQGTAWDAEDILAVAPPRSAGSIRALASMDDKLAILCERGIFFTGGDGLDNLGQGQDFLTPVHVSDLGVIDPRSVAETPFGVFFVGASVDGQAGIYLLARNLQVVDVGKPVQDDLATSDLLNGHTTLTYDEDQQVIYVTRTGAGGVGRILRMDLATSRWSIWTHATAFSDADVQYITAARGVLWKTSAANFVGSFTSSNGSDTNGTTSTAFTQLWRSNHLPIAGSGLSWGRLRSVNVLGTGASDLYDIPTTMQVAVAVIYDRSRAGNTWSGAQTVDGTVANALTWPTGRPDLEFRATTQKCAEAQITVTATPGLLRLNAIELRVRDLNGRAPKTTQRS